MPLVINSFGGRHTHTQTQTQTHTDTDTQTHRHTDTHTHTHTHTQTRILTIRTRSSLRNQARVGLWLACTWFKNLAVYDFIKYNNFRFGVCLDCLVDVKC